MFQHRIEDCQQFPRTGGERHLLGFAARTQALIEGPDHRIEAGCEDGTHVEDRAHLRPSASDGASPPQCAAVTIQWRHADESRNLLVRQGAASKKVPATIDFFGSGS